MARSTSEKVFQDAMLIPENEIYKYKSPQFEVRCTIFSPCETITTDHPELWASFKAALDELRKHKPQFVKLADAMETLYGQYVFIRKFENNSKVPISYVDRILNAPTALRALYRLPAYDRPALRPPYELIDAICDIEEINKRNEYEGLSDNEISDLLNRRYKAEKVAIKSLESAVVELKAKHNDTITKIKEYNARVHEAGTYDPDKHGPIVSRPEEFKDAQHYAEPVTVGLVPTPAPAAPANSNLGRKPWELTDEMIASVQPPATIPVPDDGFTTPDFVINKGYTNGDL